MGAGGETRTAWWRRWASLPVVVALLFATSMAAPAARPGPAAGPGQVPMAVQAVSTAWHQAAGHRPDAGADARGRAGSVAPDPGALAWLPARAGTGSAAWWHRQQDADGHRAQARRETYQGRGPPGQRAGDALS